MLSLLPHEGDWPVPGDLAELAGGTGGRTVGNENRTRKELINELGHLRQQLAQVRMIEAERRLAEAALRESRELFRKIFAESPIAIQLCDAEGKFVDMNRACLDMFGMSGISDYYHDWRGIFDGPYMPDAARQKLGVGQAAGYEVQFDFDEAREAGIYRGTKVGKADYEVLVSPLDGRGRRPSGYLFQMQDVTERKRAYAALRESEELFRSIFAESPIAIQLCDAAGHFIGMNRACLEMLGIASMAECPWRGIDDTPFVPDEHRRELRSGAVVRYEVSFAPRQARKIRLPQSGRAGTAWYHVLASPLGSESGSPTSYLIQIQDVTDRTRAQMALRELSRRLVEVQESERRHLARELHDEIGQALTGLNILLEMAVREASTAMRPGLLEAKALTNDLMMRVGDLSLALRPPMLDDLGLLPTLVWHFERYTSLTGVSVGFEQSGLDRRFAPEIETAVYRLVQEALTNVARHAAVADATVRLVADGTSLVVQVQDHGAGFDTETALAGGASSGLVGMSERAISVGGHLAVESVPGHGTLLRAEIPLEATARQKGEAK